MPIAFTQRAAAAPDVLVRELQGESVLLNLKNESYYGLDQVGTRMWELVTNADSIEAAYQALLAEYDVPPDTLRSDMQRLLADLADHGLITIHNAPVE